MEKGVKMELVGRVEIDFFKPDEIIKCPDCEELMSKIFVKVNDILIVSGFGGCFCPPPK